MIYDISDKITDEQIRPLQIIAAAMNIGVFLFFIIVMYLYFMNIDKNITPPKNGISVILLGLLAVITLTNLMLSTIISDRNMARQIKSGSQSELTTEKLIEIYRTGLAIKLAALEVAALFGLVILLLSVLNGEIYSNQLLWLAVFPMIIMHYITLFNFPSKDRVAEKLNNILQL